MWPPTPPAAPPTRPPEDAGALAAAMAGLAGEPDTRRAWGKAARERSLRYDRRRVVPQVLGEYENWLAGLGGGAKCPEFRF